MMGNAMFNACAHGGGFMLFIGLLLLAVVGLGIAALVKYLFWSGPRSGSDSHAERLTPSASGTNGEKAWPA